MINILLLWLFRGKCLIARIIKYICFSNSVQFKCIMAGQKKQLQQL